MVGVMDSEDSSTRNLVVTREPVRIPTIGIATGLEAGARRMLDALGSILHIRFEERREDAAEGLAAWISGGASTVACVDRPSYNAPRVPVHEPSEEGCSVFEFSRHALVPSMLTGQRLRDVESDRAARLRPYHGDVILASNSDGPVWLMKERGGKQHHVVSLPIPCLKQGEAVFDYFNGRRFMALVPLIVFLRSVAEGPGWEDPPLQACFMVDDPNLHWNSYGFIHYKSLANHAQRCGYHVAFATVPLDSWWVNKRTAELFRHSRVQLSLLVHGNDHTPSELARVQPGERTERLLGQAMARIEHLERISGLEVARVMAAPHGACSESTLATMARYGFEAATISSGSLRRFNGQAPWIATVGIRPADIIGGLPVFQRCRFSSPAIHRLRIAALLGQPLISGGHHGDFADGLHLLAGAADFVNSIGRVVWTDMKTIARSRYLHRIDGSTLRIRLASNRVDVRVPEGVRELVIEEEDTGSASPLTSLESRPSISGSAWREVARENGVAIADDDKIHIRMRSPECLSSPHGGSRRISLWPFMRRQATEARDRLAPAMRRAGLHRFHGKR